MTHIYEQEQLQHFYNQIVSGRISKSQLEHLLENNQLTEGQLRVIEELSPIIGGLKNVGSAIGQTAKNVASGAGNAIRRGAQNVKSAYTQGADQQKIKNQQKMQGRQWKNIDDTVTRSQLFQKLDTFRKMFPQDKYINDATKYINHVFLEMQNYLSSQYPHMGVQTDPNYQSKANQQQAQADIGADALDRQETRQRPVQTQPRRRVQQRRVQG